MGQKNGHFSVVPSKGKVPARTRKLSAGLLQQAGFEEDAIEVRMQRAGDAEHYDPAQRHFLNDNLGYLTRLLVQVNLPHRNPGVQEWERVNGESFLRMVSGKELNAKTGKLEFVGLPYGNMPRLIMIYLCSEAICNQSRRIGLGRSLSEFLKRLDLDTSGPTYRRFKEQMRRLVNAQITVGYAGKMGQGKKNYSVSDEHFFFWEDNNEVSQENLFESYIELHPKFFDEIMEHKVPIDLRIVKVLRESPLALDLYWCLTHRVSYLEKGTKIQWKHLQEHLGSNYADTAQGRKDFQKKAKKALHEITRLWSVNVEVVRGGILLEPSEPSVPRAKVVAFPQEIGRKGA